MKRVLTSLLILSSLLFPAFAFAGQAAAVDIFEKTCNANGAGSGSAACKSVKVQQDNNNQNPIIRIIKGAINILSFLIGIAAIITLVVSGIRLMTAGGDASAVASARSGVVYALVGIAVAALAQVLVLYVIGK